MTKLFRKIESMLNAQKNTFVIIFIDEVESLTSARQHSAESHEPRDALRVRVFGFNHAPRYDTCENEFIETSLILLKAVNALLTALDRLVTHPNVVILSTSNLVKAMVRGTCFYETEFNQISRTRLS